MTQDYEQVLNLFPDSYSNALDFFILKIKKTLFFYKLDGNKKNKLPKLSHTEPEMWFPKDVTFNTTDLNTDLPDKNEFKKCSDLFNTEYEPLMDEVLN